VRYKPHPFFLKVKNIMEKYLLTSNDCPHCPVAKTWAKEHNDIKLLNLDESKDAIEMAEKNGVMSIPCFIEDGQKYTFNEYKRKYNGKNN